MIDPSKERGRAYVAFGSNIDPENNIVRALKLLNELAPIGAVSTVYRTNPVQRPHQSEYYNGVCAIRAAQDARALKFDILRPIERRLGRVRTADAYALRTIDLDLLLLDDLVISEEDLNVPDPDIRERPFVALPLLEIAPTLILPDTGEALCEVARSMQTGALSPLPEFTHRLKEELQVP